MLVFATLQGDETLVKWFGIQVFEWIIRQSVFAYLHIRHIFGISTSKDNLKLPYCQPQREHARLSATEIKYDYNSPADIGC